MPKCLGRLTLRGGTLATPIINFPDVAILGVHRIMTKPGVVETPQGDKIEVRSPRVPSRRGSGAGCGGHRRVDSHRVIAADTETRAR